mgnify:CR=1 FL=1
MTGAETQALAQESWQSCGCGPFVALTGEALTHVSFFYPAFGVENKTPMSGFVARRDGRA